MVRFHPGAPKSKMQETRKEYHTTMDVFDCLPRSVRDRINTDPFGYSREFIYKLAHDHLIKEYDEMKLHAVMDYEMMMINLQRIK